MGKSLIIKGADFSENAVPILPEGYMNLTEENALDGQDLYFALAEYRIGADTPGEHPCMLYWKLPAGSIVKITPNKNRYATFGFFTQKMYAASNYRPYLVQGFDNAIRLQPNTEMQTYTLSSECWFQLYQGNNKTLFPSILIYKP